MHARVKLHHPILIIIIGPWITMLGRVSSSTASPRRKILWPKMKFLCSPAWIKTWSEVTDDTYEVSYLLVSFVLECFYAYFVSRPWHELRLPSAFPPSFKFVRCSIVIVKKWRLFPRVATLVSHSAREASVRLIWDTSRNSIGIWTSRVKATRKS